MKQLELISKSIDNFLSDPPNSEVFQYLYDNEIKGWEKWLQISLAYQLKNIGKPELEAPFKYDKRISLPTKKSANLNGYIDIQFLAKNHLQNRPTAVELKIGQSNSSLKKLLSDLEKIGACVESDWNFRAVYGVLIFKTTDNKSTKFDRLLKDLATLDKRITYRDIEKTKFSVLVLGWERGRVQNMSRINYRKWLEEISALYETHRVILAKKRSRDLPT